MLRTVKSALLLGVRLARMSKPRAKKELKRVLKVSKAGAKEADAMLRTAYGLAKREKAMLKRIVSQELRSTRTARVVRKVRRVKRAMRRKR